MEREFETGTYGVGNPLRLNAGHYFFQKKNPEVKAKLDLDTGEVKFFVEEKDLKKLRQALD